MAAAGTNRKAPRSAARVLRYAFWVTLLSVGLAGAIYGAQQFEQFLMRDPRFVLPGPVDYGQASPNLRIDGVHYASRAQVQRVFAPDFGRSVFLFPLAERRKQLTRIGWIRDAAIVRVWPNHIFVRVTERRPAAFLELRSDSISRWSLIDSDGVILEPPARASFQLPIVSGIRPGEPLAMRGMRMRRVLSMLNEIGPLADKVSEVDVADLDDLRVTEQMQDHAVLLMLGDRNFRARIQNFADHYAEMHKHNPAVTAFDLRIDDRITAVDPEPRLKGEHHAG